MLMSAFIFFPFFGIGLLFYFLPTLLALMKSKRDTISIFVLNLLLGWTFIGWVVALVWALKADVPVIAR